MRKRSVVGSVCLYGASHVGYGYLAGPADNPAQFGDGEPRHGRSLNDAVWLGLLDLRDSGYIGIVQVFAPGGRVMAEVSNASVLPYYGSMQWQPAPVYEISTAAILAAEDSQ